jgi:hypothetical protein
LEHTSTHTTPDAGAKPIVAPISGGLAGASIGLGFFSAVVFWWFPFSPILSSVGLILGIVSLIRGVRGPRGENFALAGTCICATSLTLTITLNFVLRYLQWDSLF